MSIESYDIVTVNAREEVVPRANALGKTVLMVMMMRLVVVMVMRHCG